MKITALRLFNVRRFANRGVAIEGIGDGVNVLCAANEFGKSTSFEALHALFFQQHTSTAGDVRNLRPYSGGNPVVEADIETATARYRITKQFYGGRSARVVELASGRMVAQADEAENFISELVRGGTTGPAGLLWVRQGVTGIEKRSKADEDGEKQVRASLLESVQGEVEAVTGGRRMAEIMAATEEALGRLVTATGRPKAGSPYAAAIEERDRLETEKRRLAAEVTLLREALDKRAATSKRLTELDRAEDRAERAKAIEAAQAAFDAAKTQAETLRAAEAELRLAREQRDRAGRDLKEFQAALRRAAELRDRFAEAERRRDEALGRRDAAAHAARQASADHDAAEAEEREALALLARLDAAMRARDAAGRLAELESMLERAEATRREIEEANAALALLNVPEPAVSELEKLEVEIARLEAVAEAARPSVAIAYAPQAAAVTLDGRPLAEGEPRSYESHAELAIPGIGVVTLRSGRSPGGDARLAEAGERRRALFASIGVADLAEARRRQAEAQRKDSELRELKGRLSLLAPDGLPKLREEVARQREAAGTATEPEADPDEARTRHEAAEAKRAAARARMRASDPAQASAVEAVVAAQAALAGLASERSQLDAVLGPEEERAGRERLLADALREREEALARKEAAAADLQRKAVDLAAAEATLRRVRSVAEGTDKEIGRLREEIAGLAAAISARSDDAVEEKWRETADRLAAARTRAAAYEKEVAVLQRLRSALETARSQARETYLLPVMTELRPLLGLLFDDVEISFDEKTLLPHKILRNGQEEEVERLSGGMREQLSVLTRLAFARLLARDGRPAPVILDDALVYSDDDRIEKMFDALHRQAREQQIIVFSCRQRAFQKLGGNVLHVSDWSRAE